MPLGPIHCGSFLLFAAFALLLVATISAPVIKQISFLDVTGLGRKSTFGVFGYCLNIDSSPSGCTSSKVGYSLTTAARSITGLSLTSGSLTSSSLNLSSTLNNLTRALILHPIACGLTFLSLLISLCSDRLGFVFASLIALLAFLVSLAAMVIDFVLFAILRREVRREVNNAATGSTFGASFGNAIWLVLVATVLLFFSVFFVLFSCCTARRNRTRGEGIGRGGGYAQEGYVGNGPAVGGYEPVRRRWWQRSAKY